MQQFPPFSSFKSNNYCIEVSLQKPFRTDESVSSTSKRHFRESILVRLCILIKVNFQSSGGDEVTGHSTSQKFCALSHEIRKRETLKKFMDLLNIPFSLEKLQWKGVGTENKPLENYDDLIREVCDNMRQSSLSEHGFAFLCIKKMVKIPDSEFIQWKSFSKDRPRDYLELIHYQPALQMYFRKEALKVLEMVRVQESDEHWAQYSSQQCSICLENLLEGDISKLIRMSCFHVFHEVCILNWLIKNKQTCPFCRSVAPAIEFEGIRFEKEDEQ